MRAAVFLDRDGVLIEDRGLVVDSQRIRILPGVPEALAGLARAGFALVVVTNQAVVARGLCDEEDVAGINCHIADMIKAQGGPALEAFFVCPHHPDATLRKYRQRCACRKPRPGLLFQASRALGIDLRRSYLVGDRMTDIIAGAHAGCCTILVKTGAHLASPIVTAEPIDPGARPDHLVADLAAATTVVLESR